MSRIQQILSKAERDGTVRHTHAPAADPAQRGIDEIPRRRPVSAPSGLPAHEPGPRLDSPAPMRSRLVEAGSLSPLLVVATAPHAAVAEQYRAVRTRLALSEDGHARRVLVVSSPSKGDGKSVTAANLALAMAQEFSRRVALVDTDLRRPALHALFGLPQSPGLAEVLLGLVTLEDALVSLPDYRLTLLPAGQVPDAPAELLGSGGMRRVLDTLRSRFDRVLLDTPPAQPLADVGVLAPMADGVLLVVRAGTTPKPLIDRALEICEPSRVVGLVLNDTGDSDAAYHRYAGQAAG